MNRIFVLLSLLLIPFIYSQEVEEIDINEERNNQINELIQVIKTNKSIYVNQDNKRLNKFIDRVEERTKLLNDAKRLLANEEKRNKELEDAFESNEKELADLEEKLQIKIGVLGELFGVTRQYAGELVASNQDSVVFYEFPEREKTLKDIAVIQVHNLEQLEDLWLAYFDEIGAGSEIKTFNAKITNPSGESFEGEVTRYGLFNAVHNNNFLKPVSSLNSFQLLPKQPERSIIKSVKKHSQSTDGFSSVAIDPTRGFLLSLYLDKPGWFERIAQGRTIGFIIILIGLVGLIFSAYKIYLLNNHSNNIIENSSIDSNMTNLLKDANSRESKENLIDEYIINYSKDIEWGNNWVKFFAAVAPLLGLLGTVIGMIETFQAITLFGTGDPKQMAGGISQALITTMLGLIVAAPLLGFYTYLSEKASSLIQILEEKASYVLSKD
jgi:biopolymer transport protein ExbB